MNKSDMWELRLLFAVVIHAVTVDDLAKDLWFILAIVAGIMMVVELVWPSKEKGNDPRRTP